MKDRGLEGRFLGLTVWGSTGLRGSITTKPGFASELESLNPKTVNLEP